LIGDDVGWNVSAEGGDFGTVANDWTNGQAQWILPAARRSSWGNCGQPRE
jgi:hypothetical protein